MPDFDPTQSSALTPTTSQPLAARPAQPAVRTISPNVEQTDFSDESVRKYEFELYSGKANQTDRIYIPYVNGVIRARTHFVDRGTTKFSLVCRSQYVKRADGSGEDLMQEASCCKLLGASQQRWAVLMIQYGTDRTGQVVKPFSLYRKLWRFGSDKYQQLRNISRDFPLDQHDLSIYCQPDGEQFQKLQIGAKPDCWLLHPGFPAPERTGIQEWARASVNRLPREMGRVYATDAEMLRDLQVAGVLTPAGAAPMMASDQPVINFDDVIGTTGIVQK